MVTINVSVQNSVAQGGSKNYKKDSTLEVPNKHFKELESPS